MIVSTEHFSFTVSDLNESLHFFRDLLGLEATPTILVETEGVRQIIGMADARLKISLVKIPDGKNIELIQYLSPTGIRQDLSTCNTGVAHIAFNVQGIEGMYEDLKAKGVEFVSAPVWAPGNDGTGKWAVCYLRGPDGITLEFIERTVTEGSANEKAVTG
jgi:catechol 2,3-dioxygenase-like lactoylglutathione lyase family enzyme